MLAARIAFVGCVLVIAWESLLPPEQIPYGPAVSDKAVHAVGYALLGALAVVGGLRWLPAVALATGLGLVLEVAQLMSGYRSFEWADLAADAAGAAAGALLVTALVRRSVGGAVSPSS